jgi:hypothetical protein
MLLTAAVCCGVALLGAVYLLLWADDLVNSPWVERCFWQAQQADERAVTVEPCEGAVAMGRPRSEAPCQAVVEDDAPVARGAGRARP